MFNPLQYFEFGKQSNVCVPNTLLTNLLHSYDFEETSGLVATDGTGNYDGVISGGVTLGGTGIVENSYDYDGVNGTVNFNNNLDITSYPFSVKLWFYVDALATEVVLSGSPVSSYSGITILPLADGRIIIRFGDGTGLNAPNRLDYVTTGITYATGWNHIVVNVTDFSTLGIYVNNINYSYTVNTGSATSLDFAQSVYSLMSFGNSSFWSGKVDQFRVWNRLLTVGEIDYSYNTELGGQSDITPCFIGSAPEEAQPLVETTNKGIGGNNTSDIINRLADVNSANGDLVILMVGTNDWRHPTASKRRTTAQYETNLTTIVQSLKANGSDVLMMSFPPILQAESDYVCAFYGEASGCDSDATGDQFRAKIPLVATAESVMYFDMWQEWENVGQPTELVSSYIQNFAILGSNDGVHPTATGADFIAEKIKDYYISNTLSYTNIVCLGDSITFGQGLTGAGTNTGDTYPSKLKEKLNTI